MIFVEVYIYLDGAITMILIKLGFFSLLNAVNYLCGVSVYTCLVTCGNTLTSCYLLILL